MILLLAPAGRQRQLKDLVTAALALIGTNEDVVLAADEVESGAQWPEEVANRMSAARLVVCDVTEAGSNIRLELELAARSIDDSVAPDSVTSRRPYPSSLLLVAEGLDRIPADISSYQVLIYGASPSEAIPLLARHLLSSLSGSDRYRPAPPSIFVSYAHHDVRFLDELTIHLKPLVRDGLIDRWDDRRIRVGGLWRQEIGFALEHAAAAVLLVSPYFYASDFIVENELPPLLTAAEFRGVKIYPVIVSYCRFARDEKLGRFQAHNDPASPLASLAEWERDKVFDALAAEVEKDLVTK